MYLEGHRRYFQLILDISNEIEVTDCECHPVKLFHLWFGREVKAKLKVVKGKPNVILCSCHHTRTEHSKLVCRDALVPFVNG